MFDQMSMPVLFAVLITTLALVSAGIFVAVRILAEKSQSGKLVKKVPHAPLPQQTSDRSAVEPDETTSVRELD
ncbi:hypothetical protein F1D05_28515 [Kribbella qitaiheensis]|uniref:Uncharacterized protein n=1 Tax=Kribbella qitaiheensis TaxID=1544730 RepID=A0A7G6X4H1_9ACTN|nr:hypothetical protein [Kribbella qitaiheensis]QNE21136.1 hypothetical protein F1D05_28515 [Kribbella qitaiheensis]